MKQFQKIIGLIILIVILASFGFDKGFIIKGHIDGIEDGTWVKLYDTDQQKILDSVLSKNGNFILKGKVEYPTSFRVHCKNEYAVIQVENTEMTFNSPIKKMLLNNIAQGGNEQRLQNELNKLRRPYLNLFYGAYDSLENKKYSSDSEKQRLIKLFNESQSTAQEIYVNFGKKHANSFIGLDIIYSNRESIPKDSLKLLYEKLLPKYKETPRSKGLKIFLYDELAQKGKPFIDFNVKTIKGEDFKLSSLKGKYIYFSFWNSTCPACRLENRFLSTNFNELPTDLELVSFSTDKNAENWNIATKSDSISWHNISDLEGDSGRVKNQYQVQAMPTSFLIDKNGNIMKKFIGFDADIIKRIKKLIEENQNKH